MNKKEFRTKAYPIILEALLRATNGDNVQILVSSVGAIQEAVWMIESMISPVDIQVLGYAKFSLENNAVVSLSLNKKDGFNSTLEIV